MRRFPPETILVPTDLSEAAASAFAFARWFHERFGSVVTVFHAEHLEVPPYFTSGQTKELLGTLGRLRAAAKDEIRQAVSLVLGFSPEVVVVEGYPSDAIGELCHRGNFDLVIMGTHGRRGARRLWLGSVTERVIRTASCPVLATRPFESPGELHRVLCPVGYSETSREALDYAARIAQSFDAELLVIHAVEEGAAPLHCPGVDPALRKRCRIEEDIEMGDPVERVLRFARDVRPDLVVMGGRRKTSVWGEIFSTTTEQVMRRIELPLLVVPTGGEEPAADTERS